MSDKLIVTNGDISSKEKVSCFLMTIICTEEEEQMYKEWKLIFGKSDDKKIKFSGKR